MLTTSQPDETGLVPQHIPGTCDGKCTHGFSYYMSCVARVLNVVLGRMLPILLATKQIGNAFAEDVGVCAV